MEKEEAGAQAPEEDRDEAAKRPVAWGVRPQPDLLETAFAPNAGRGKHISGACLVSNAHVRNAARPWSDRDPGVIRFNEKGGNEHA